MFFRYKSSLQNGVTYEYLQIAESYRLEGKPRQRVLATLGRRDRLEAAGKIELQLPSGPLTLGPDEIQVRLSAKPDYAASASHGHVVVLDTRVSDELKREGFAREVVNRVQRARKTMDLEYEARIRLQYRAAGELALAISEHAQLIASETLAQSLALSEQGEGQEHAVDVDGEPLTFWVSLR